MPRPSSKVWFLLLGRGQQALFLSAGISFTRDGRYLALAERRDCKDHVSIFVCSDWQLLRVGLAR